ncbi:transcription antitermination factor NusB [Tissierella praeacuta]|uniref:Transcription antitermination protein NusB n=1 Tax=Tissierella praeacuta DSM 18095 TaxID=1123404 RepID=A0A1M4SDA8_9FIRM|nr:transcription antitermination factor NusB [Tissierella praeacuta]MBU5254878.1 transcription antitermination factor NusB [Tissierella praeacuta]SHE30181.1 NusB antitermination factor [Tissierella praeacuta DSM 18095]SUP01305.1 N utilization substance protein B homolog [Tissierella praeacuta]
MGRKQAREGTMKILYQMEVNDDFSDEALNIYFNNFSFEELEKEYILDAMTKIKENLDSIDKYIELYSQGWNLNRLAKIDLAVLRIAVYEILYRKDIPVEVSINEAIEIVKKYSTEESFRFINGVLGGVVRNIDKK